MEDCFSLNGSRQGDLGIRLRNGMKSAPWTTKKPRPEGNDWIYFQQYDAWNKSRMQLVVRHINSMTDAYACEDCYGKFRDN